MNHSFDMISNGISETASSKPKAAVERVAMVVVAEAAEDAAPLTQCNQTNIQKAQTWVKAEAVEAEARVAQVAGEALVEEKADRLLTPYADSSLKTSPAPTDLNANSILVILLISIPSARRRDLKACRMYGRSSMPCHMAP